MWVRPVPEVIQDPPPSPQVYGDDISANGSADVTRMGVTYFLPVPFWL